MPILSPETSALLMIDFQVRLMPAIDHGAVVLANASRLLKAARCLDVPVVSTEQNPTGLGPSVPELALPPGTVQVKMTFDAFRMPGADKALPDGRDLVVCGCEAHVCVLQTVLGLLARGRRVYVVSDAVGSRRPESKRMALHRMESHGAEIVTAEMVLFEWIGSCEHPRFRDILSLVR